MLTGLRGDALERAGLRNLGVTGPALMLSDRPMPRSSCVAMLGSLELLTNRPEGEGGDLPPLAGAGPDDGERGSGDKSMSDSGEEAYDRREVMGKRKSSDRYSSSCDKPRQPQQQTTPADEHAGKKREPMDQIDDDKQVESRKKRVIRGQAGRLNEQKVEATRNQPLPRGSRTRGGAL